MKTVFLKPGAAIPKKLEPIYLYIYQLHMFLANRYHYWKVPKGDMRSCVFRKSQKTRAIQHISMSTCGLKNRQQKYIISTKLQSTQYMFFSRKSTFLLDIVQVLVFSADLSVYDGLDGPNALGQTARHVPHPGFSRKQV